MPQSPCSIPVSYGLFYVVSMDWYHLWNQSGSVARSAGRPKPSPATPHAAQTPPATPAGPKSSPAMLHAVGAACVARNAAHHRGRSHRRALPMPLPPSRAADAAAAVARGAGATAPAPSTYCLLAGTCGRFFSTCSSHRRRYLRARCLSPALAYWCDSSI